MGKAPPQPERVSPGDTPNTDAAQETRKASERLKVGDAVVFSDGVRGQVIEIGYSAVKIAWADGQVGIIHHDDMQDVSRAEPFLRNCARCKNGEHLCVRGNPIACEFPQARND